MTAQSTDTAAARRRAALAKRMGDGIAVVVAGEESKTETQRPFRQDPRFLYLTGFSEPQAALILRAQGGKIARLIFLCRAKDAAAERWDGRRAGPAAAARMLEADEAIEFSWEALARSLEAESDKSETLYFLPGDDARIDKVVMRLAARRRRLNRAGFRPLTALADLAQIVDAMRAIKDESEIAALRKAAQIAVAAHKDAMRAALRAQFEREIEAALIARYRAEGAHHAFAPIVAAGANGLRFALHRQRRAGARARFNFGRFGLRISRLRVGYHARVSGARQIFVGAKRRLRSRARSATKSPRASQSRGALADGRRRGGRARWRRACGGWAFCADKRGRLSRAASCAVFICTASATCWEWMFTMSASCAFWRRDRS